LLEPALLALFLAGWLLLPGAPAYWTAAALGVLCLPVYCTLLFSLLRMPVRRRGFRAWLRNTLEGFVNGHAVSLLALIFLLHQALLSIDAIVRSILRVWFTRRKLLEWETAAESEAASRSKATVDIYLEWTPLLAAALIPLVGILRPAALPIAAPVLGLWLISGLVSAWLNRPPRTLNRALATADARWLHDNGEKIYRFFHDWSSLATNWLVPDSVDENGGAVLRLSPTNLGMLLNARMAGLHLGAITLSEFVFETRQTLDRILALPKYRGHLLNWYDISTMLPVPPRVVSTVDSGNLAASLWTLKQAALAFAVSPPRRHDLTPEMASELTDIASICDRLVREMDFRFLYNQRRHALSIGFDLSAARVEPGCYDLLASESRLATFIAIAKGDIPQQAWFQLGRSHTLFHGERILLSWTGTMFEYLMPALWMRHYPGTITERSLRGVVRAQREYANAKGVPWGISESAWRGEQGDSYGYAPFGIPDLALKRPDYAALVVSPYSTFLALTVDPSSALKNLRRMQEFGWCGRYGFYEAAHYSNQGASLMRSWMAHHQGMSLLAICNLLFDNPMQRYFHAEPQVLATELLLHERLPAAIEPEVGLAVPIPQAPAEA
jgi:cyclic beta-1,2-glucan synthetase